MWKFALVVATLVALTACSALQPQTDLSPATLVAVLEPGDRIRVSTAEDPPLDLRVRSVGDGAIRGTTSDGKIHTVPLDSVTRLERRVTDRATTTWVVVGVLAAGAAAIALSDSGGGGEGGRDGPDY